MARYARPDPLDAPRLAGPRALHGRIRAADSEAAAANTDDVPPWRARLSVVRPGPEACSYRLWG